MRAISQISRPDVLRAGGRVVRRCALGCIAGRRTDVDRATELVGRDGSYATGSGEEKAEADGDRGRSQGGRQRRGGRLIF